MDTTACAMCYLFKFINMPFPAMQSLLVHKIELMETEETDERSYLLVAALNFLL